MHLIVTVAENRLLYNVATSMHIFQIKARILFCHTYSMEMPYLNLVGKKDLLKNLRIFSQLLINLKSRAFIDHRPGNTSNNSFKRKSGDWTATKKALIMRAIVCQRYTSQIDVPTALFHKKTKMIVKSRLCTPLGRWQFQQRKDIPHLMTD